jgi:hypothetical protein
MGVVQLGKRFWLETGQFCGEKSALLHPSGDAESRSAMTAIPFDNAVPAKEP